MSVKPAVGSQPGADRDAVGRQVTDRQTNGQANRQAADRSAPDRDVVSGGAAGQGQLGQADGQPAVPRVSVGRMRLGVIDIGSNTVHLLVVDAHVGGQPLPAASVKVPLRLVELLDSDGALSAAGERTLTETIIQMRGRSDDLGVDDLVAFATSALRDATNSGAV
ncbi:Ppx/GppA phosphatase family protein, partial [Frankia sp. Cr2]|uniref:Ppx/GppA phosphatase family protein n=1 Tax=Frankia sp. Cr2 TaxID=3073932 RepID=UPI003A0FC03C